MTHMVWNATLCAGDGSTRSISAVGRMACVAWVLYEALCGCGGVSFRSVHAVASAGGSPRLPGNGEMHKNLLDGMMRKPTL